MCESTVASAPFIKSRSLATRAVYAVRYPSSLFVGMNVSTSSPPRLLTPLAVSKAPSNLLAPGVEARARGGPCLAGRPLPEPD